MRQVRDLARARYDLVEDRTRVKQRIEKLLEDALIKISSVLTDVLPRLARRLGTPVSAVEGVDPGGDGGHPSDDDSGERKSIHGRTVSQLGFPLPVADHSSGPMLTMRDFETVDRRWRNAPTTTTATAC
jgi:hypothetical protein